MSFWNFLGEFAVFNMICNWFSHKPKSSSQTVRQSICHDFGVEQDARTEALNHRIDAAEKRISEYHRLIDDMPTGNGMNHDIDELQDRIDELECQLVECDVMSDRYDLIMDEIDTLQERLDDIEYNQDIYDDLQEELDDLYDELDDLQDELDDDDF